MKNVLESRSRLKPDPYTIKYYDVLLNRWERMSRADQFEVRNNLETMKVVNFYEEKPLSEVSSYAHRKLLYDVNNFNTKTLE